MAEVSNVPTRKVAVGALAGSVSTITVWSLSEFAAIKLPPEIAVAATVVITFIIQYLVPDAQEAP